MKLNDLYKELGYLTEEKRRLQEALRHDNSPNGVIHVVYGYGDNGSVRVGLDRNKLIKLLEEHLVSLEKTISDYQAALDVAESVVEGLLEKSK